MQAKIGSGQNPDDFRAKFAASKAGVSSLGESLRAEYPNGPIKVTVLEPWLPPKLVPAMVTEIPLDPEVGLRLVMLGVRITVKATPLLGTPPTVTTAGPVVAPAGTGTMATSPKSTDEAIKEENTTINRKLNSICRGC